MSDAAPAPSREEEVLARLMERDLAAAEKVHDRLMAAEANAEIAELGRTYQRLARSVRQTVALKAKLTREREAAARAAPAPKPDDDFERLGIKVHSPQVRAHVDRVAAAVMPYLERERPDFDELDEVEVYDILLDMAEADDFLTTPAEVLAERVRAQMDPEPDTEPAAPEPDTPPPEPDVRYRSG